jgi:hypothetical protein
MENPDFFNHSHRVFSLLQLKPILKVVQTLIPMAIALPRWRTQLWPRDTPRGLAHHARNLIKFNTILLFSDNQVSLFNTIKPDGKKPRGAILGFLPMIELFAPQRTNIFD